MGANELQDLNRGRAYLADVATRHGVVVYSNIQKALLECLKKLNSMELVRLCPPDRSAEPESAVWNVDQCVRIVGFALR